ncbi:class I SAM-dependent methyltransferase [Nonomuraea diastatica]|uniref:Class I SAM-dependent methyltransferase n=1 Tax=Nonomuraea diastatica TaxID=1848329 RepID=A0A4R4WK16_9ACTN|nr:class I SAM-dependent methyltransferase [Nonomuraea diastatica]TDD16854.1 class I SAM-dependent methyltransferase [Nonomuraea diastatica]
MEAAYDEIADWYEREFMPRDGDDRLRIRRSIRELLGQGSGPCLETGCGTGAYAGLLSELGWTPVGMDLSAGMLGYARSRLPVVRGDAERLPFRDGVLPAVVSVMVHTDMPGYMGVLRGISRVLRPGGVLVHVGVHPCFVGGFADWSDRDAVVIRPGYLDRHRTNASWTSQGLRDKVGASHWPLPELLHGFLDAGFALERFAEGCAPVPMTLSVRARRAVGVG